jgi:hypothetical protein
MPSLGIDKKAASIAQQLAALPIRTQDAIAAGPDADAILSDMKTRKHPGAVALGRLGGQARARVLTKAERSAIATKAIEARWARWRAARKAAK